MKYKLHFLIFASPSWFLLIILIILSQLIKNNNNGHQLFLIKWSITILLSGFTCGIIGIIVGKSIEKSTTIPYLNIILLGFCWSVANSIFWKSTALAAFYVGMPTDIKIPLSYLINYRTLNQMLSDVGFFSCLCIPSILILSLILRYRIAPKKHKMSVGHHLEHD